MAYTGLIYRFCFLHQELVARRYDDTPSHVSFLGAARSRKGSVRGWSTTPYSDAAFREAVSYLREREAIKTIDVLLDQYVPVDLAYGLII
jgi:hypothetical protein